MKDGYFYLGELHPAKKYLNKGYPRFTSKGKTISIPTYTHHLSDFVRAGKANELVVVDINEWFYEENHSLPQVLSLVFKKN